MNELRVWKYQATGNDFVMTFDPDDERPLSPKRSRRSATAASASGPTGRSGSDAVATTARSWTIATPTGASPRCAGTGSAASRSCSAASAQRWERPSRSTRGPVSAASSSSPTGGSGWDMGAPGFTKAAIPMRGPAWETFVDQPIDLGGSVVPGTALSMGNPHLVLFLDHEPEWPQVAHVGPVLEGDGRFPEGTNVEFAHGRPRDRGARVGAGERGDVACGSGACAVGVAAHEMGLAERATRVRFPGGVLDVDREDDGSPLTGAAARILEGTVDTDALLEAATVTPSIAERLAARVEALVAILSESRAEVAILDEIERAVPGGWTLVADDGVRLATPERRPATLLVLLAGHVDTVPIGRSAPAAARAARSTVAEQRT